MKLIITFIIFTVTVTGMAPDYKYLYLFPPDEINEYDRLFDAVCEVESSNNIYSFNAKEEARGVAQIRPSRVQHYNVLTGKDYSPFDCYSKDISREIFLYFCHGKDYETAARNWNGGNAGRWELTNDYWQRVKTALHE